MVFTVSHRRVIQDSCDSDRNGDLSPRKTLNLPFNNSPKNLKSLQECHTERRKIRKLGASQRKSLTLKGLTARQPALWSVRAQDMGE